MFTVQTAGPVTCRQLKDTIQEKFEVTAIEETTANHFAISIRSLNSVGCERLTNLIQKVVGVAAIEEVHEQVAVKRM